MYSVRLFVAMVAIAVAGEVRAQALPEGPIRVLDGKVTVTGEVVGTFGAADTTAFFNYTDYEHNALRMMRLALAGVWRPLERVAFVGELRSENFGHVDAFGAYVRVRPFRTIAFDV